MSSAKILFWKLRPFALDGVLGLLVFGLCFRCCYGDFFGPEDAQYIYKNPQILDGLTRGGLQWAFSTYHAANWHPLTWVSLQLNVALFGSDPRAFHFADILLHSLSTVILSAALRRLTGSAILSWLTALLFAVHPLRVESVA